MASLNDFNRVDHDDDVLAEDINRLIASSLRSEYKNVQTLSGDMELTDGDTPIQRLDCGGSNRIVTMPSPNAVENHPFLIVNASDGGETITVKSNDEADTLGTVLEGKALLFLPDGAGGYVAGGGGGDVTPYRIAVSVASNNLTLALKDKDGNDPSPSSPVRVQIGDTVREITAPLSVTVNAGTNTFNAGSDELKTKEIDYFPMLAWVSASSVVAIGYSRIPFGRIGSDFSGTATNERYAAWSTAPGASDPVQVIGRFAATLSAGAGYTWSVPTFTNINLIHQPIFETRILTWQPSYSANGSMTYTSVTTNVAKYMVLGRSIKIQLYSIGTTGGSASNTLYATLPFVRNGSYGFLPLAGWTTDGGASMVSYSFISVSNLLGQRKSDSSNFGLGDNRTISVNGEYVVE